MKQVIALSVALAAALVGAYLTWTDESEEPKDDEAVAMFTASEADLQRLSWKSDELSVTLERKTDARGTYLWAELVETPKDKPKDPAHDTDHPEHAPEVDPEAAKPGETKRSRFVANTQGDDLWKSFAPLMALRELPGATDKATFGLDAPTATVEVVRGSGPLSLVVGGETYGSKDRYVESGGKVYLVDDATLRPLQYAATRLVERSLFPLAEKDVEKVSVTRGDGTTLAWVQKNADDSAKAFWARADAPDTADEAGGTWVGKVFRLKLREYVDESTLTAPLEPVATYTVEGDGEAWKVELLTSGGQWYARADFNRGLVSLTESLARNVVDDIDQLGQD